MNDSSRDEIDGLARVLDEALAAWDRGEEPDELILALRFDLDRRLVRDCLAGLAALREESSDFHCEVDPAPAEAPPRLPADYEIRGEIGRGGMGIVYRAHQRSLHREVAIKILKPGELVFGPALARFKKEAQALARLRHPNIVGIHEVGEIDGLVYFSMDLIEGETLADLIASGRLTPARSLMILRQITSAVAYVHERGIIHRDLKPANILIDRDGKPYLGDFGLARHLTDSADLTRSGQVLGTPRYMSPEQARGDLGAVGEQTDVWALGTILYECLAGRPPFTASSPLVVLNEIIHRDPPRLGRVARSTPSGLEAIVTKALEKEPARRYGGARALLEDLERFAEGRTPRAEPPSRSRAILRLARRQRVAVIAALSVILLGVILFVLLILPRYGRDPATTVALAERLWARGDQAAAASLYATIADSELPDPLFEKLVTGRLVEARQLGAAGHPEEVLALLEDLRRRGLERWEKRPDRRREPFAAWPQGLDVEGEILLATCQARGVAVAQARQREFWGEVGIGNGTEIRLARLLAPHAAEDEGNLGAWAADFFGGDEPYLMGQSAVAWPHPYQASILRRMLQRPGEFRFSSRWSATTRIEVVDGAAIETVLDLLDDPVSSPAALRAGALLVQQLLDLPPGRDRNEFHSFRDETLPAIRSLARAVWEAEPMTAYRLRVDEAFSRLEDDGDWIRGWLEDALGRPTKTTEAAELRSWWRDRRDDDPSARWLERAGLDGPRRDEDLVAMLAEASDEEAAALHRLLLWQRPRAAGRATSARADRWRLVLRQEAGTTQPRTGHAALFVAANQRLDERAVAAEAVALDAQLPGFLTTNAATRILLGHAFDLMSPAAVALSAPGLPWLPVRAMDLHYQLQLDLRADEDGRYRTTVDQSWSTPSSRSSTGFAGRPLREGRVALVGSGLRGNDPLALLVVLPAGEEAPGADLDAWRRRIARGLELELESLRGEDGNDHLLDLPELIRPALLVALPEAIPTLRALQTEVDGTDEWFREIADLVVVARLMAGDDQAVAVVQGGGHAFRPGGEVEALGEALWFWLARNAAGGAARGLAAGRLANPEKLDELLEADRRAGAPLGDWDRRRLEDHGDRRAPASDFVLTTWPLLLPFLLGLLGGLAGLVLGRAPEGRLRGATLAVFLGALFIATRFILDGRDWPLAVPGGVLAALGALRIARPIDDRRPLLPVLLFLLCALVGGARFLAPGVESLILIERLTGIGAAFALAVVARLVTGSLDEQELSLFGPLPVELLVGVLLVAVAVTLALGPLGEPTVALDWGRSLVWLGALLVFLNYLKRRPDHRRPVLPGFLMLVHTGPLLVFVALDFLAILAAPLRPERGGTPGSPFGPLSLVLFLSLSLWPLILGWAGAKRRARTAQLVAEAAGPRRRSS
ncbi:MAG: serine/threonine protein kinase [Planctomycetes bacterium]|nr:serine/threonine protein kinase [Planctomycetota bacterium]